MTINTNIQGIFHLTSPMHCASTDPLTGGDDDKKQNGIATVVQKVLVDGKSQSIPYFPANDLRGRLRRKAAAIVMEALTANNGPKIPVALYAGLNTGAISAKPDAKGVTIEEAHRANKHVYMGLFGGGARLLRSSYTVSDAIPMVKQTETAGIVPKDFGPYAHTPLPETIGWHLLDTRHILRVDDVMRVLRPAELERFVEDAMVTIPAYQESIFANRKDRKDSKENKDTPEAEVKKTDVGNMVTVQSVIPGTDLYVRVDMADTLTPAQIGLMLCSLESLINEQALGGWIRTGFGKFDARHFDLNHDGEKTEIFEVAENGQCRLSSATQPFIDAMRQEVSALTVDGLMDFFINQAPEKEKKPSKVKEA